MTYRSDADYHRAHPQARYPASWHRAVVARVAQEVPGLSIVYQESPVYIVDLSPTDAAALTDADSDLAANGLALEHLGEGRVRMPAATLDWLRSNRTPDDDGSITEDDDGLLLWIGGIPHEIRQEA